MWTRVLHHVMGEHSWVFGGCEHTPLTDNRDKPWIQKDSEAHLKIAEGCYYFGFYRYTITLATDHMDTVSMKRNGYK